MESLRVRLALSLAFAAAFLQAQNPALDSERRLVKARPLPLQSVRLTGGPLKHAQDLELEYLLALEPNRMLAFLRRSAKLEPKAQGYGGGGGGGPPGPRDHRRRHPPRAPPARPPR